PARTTTRAGGARAGFAISRRASERPVTAAYLGEPSAELKSADGGWWGARLHAVPVAVDPSGGGDASSWATYGAIASVIRNCGSRCAASPSHIPSVFTSRARFDGKRI